MIEGKTVLGVIPARGGSKGVPCKNIQKVGGKPLIAWTIEEAKKSKYIDRLILSSEDPEIIRVAEEWGCEVPFVRPKELAQDDTPGIAPVLHALEMLPGYDYVVLLQPTSPLRKVEDIDGCLEKCVRNNAVGCVTVTLPDKSPYWMYYLNDAEHLVSVFPLEKNYSRRQDLPKVYALNGAVYVSKCDWVLKYKRFVDEQTLGYVMPKERSIDVDSEWDLFLVDQIIKNTLE